MTAGAILKLRAIGRLATPPEVAVTDTGVQLAVLLDQRVPEHQQAPALLAVWSFECPTGRSDTTLYLEHCASAIRQAGGAVVVGLGLEPARWHGRACLRVIHCDAIAAATDSDPFPELRAPHTGDLFDSPQPAHQEA